MRSAAPLPPAGDPERHLRLVGTRNLRDVGGYPAGGGRRTRWRTLFRADALDQLPAESQEALLGMGLRLAIDLRWPDEIDARPSVFRHSADIRYVSLPLRDTSPSPVSEVPEAYRHMIDGRGAQIAGVVRSLLEPDGLPAVVGCAAGVDRTGIAIGVVLSAIGVPDDVVAADYALSAASYSGDDGSGLDDWRGGSIEIDCLPEYMIGTLDHLRRRHGGVAAFLASHGLADADIGRLRKLLTEPSPVERAAPP
jgi:protein-tyrosine phosphatase